MTEKTYAHVLDGLVRELLTLDADLILGQDLFTEEAARNFVDVTSVLPQPAEGWTTPDGGKTFAAPVAPVAAPQTLFSPRDFMALFTATEQKALFTARQTNIEVDMFITLAMAGNVALMNAEVIADIGAIEAAGLITADRAKQILAGTAAPSA